MQSTGYSGTPLAKKLGIKAGFTVSFLHVPDDYFDLFTTLPDNLIQTTDPLVKKDFIHYFAKSADTLNTDIKALRHAITQQGMIWISWPKKAAKVATDLDSNTVRTIGLNNGLVDIKVCAVNATWSALKFVIPVKDRI